MRCLYFITLSFLIGQNSFAQKVEFGAGGGPTFYKGDLQPTFRPLNPGMAGTLFFRYNFNRVISLKAHANYGRVHGSDKKSGDPYLEGRGFSFKNDVFDYALQVEYNFLNFRTHNGRYEHDWTPYLFGGYGKSHKFKKVYGFEDAELTITNERKAEDIIPFGIGIKKILGPQWNLSAEFSTRVFINKNNGGTFDGLNSKGNNKYTFALNSSHPAYNYYYKPNTQLSDKYFHLSVTVSYLIYRVQCNDPRKRMKFF